MATPNPLSNMRTPVTCGFLASLVLVAAGIMASGSNGASTLALWSGGSLLPWKFLTYPWAFSIGSSGMALLVSVMLLIWFYQVGSWVEKEMGSVRFLIFLATTIVMGAASVLAIATLTKSPYGLAGPFIPITAISVAWCARNQSQRVMLYGAIPIPATVLAWIFAAIVFFMHFSQGPFISLAACIPLVFAFIFASDRIPKMSFVQGNRMMTGRRFINPKQKEAVSRGQVQYDQEYFDEVKRREQERIDRERLKKLLGED